MQGRRGSGDPFFGFGDPFAGFGSFGGQMNLMPSIFGGRDPFDDPFFTRPFGGMFPSSQFGPMGNPFVEGHAPGFLEQQPSQSNQSRGPIIEELNSDDEKEAADGEREKNENPRKHGRLGKKPYVEDPDDKTEERKSKQIQHGKEFNIMNNAVSHPQARSFTFQSSSVTYGGANGAYYTSSSTQRSGSDGLTFEEHKEANSATGQAAHRLSRGIHDKGHTVARNLNSDGRVDTMQMLHNINEDELSGFEEAWNGNARKHLPGWTGGVNAHGGFGGHVQNELPSRGGWALPSTEHAHHSGSMNPLARNTAGSSRPKNPEMMRKDAGVRIDTSRGRSGAGRSGAGRSGAARTSKMDIRRH